MITHFILRPERGAFDPAAIGARLDMIAYAGPDPADHRRYFIAFSRPSLSRARNASAAGERISAMVTKVSVSEEQIGVAHHAPEGGATRRFVSWLRERIEFRVFDEERNDLSDQCADNFDFLFGPDDSRAVDGQVLADTFDVTQLVHGRSGCGQYRARKLDDGAARYLVTVGGKQRRQREQLYDALALPNYDDIVPLEHIGPFGEFDAMVELEPSGTPSHHLSPFDSGAAVAHALRVGEVLEEVHDDGRVIGSLRPALVYIDGERAILAPRCESFLNTADAADDASDACFDDSYQAPELSFDEPPTAASDVFSLCAVLAFWLTGEHPFDEQGRRRWTGPPELEEPLDAGLRREPDARSSLDELLDALEDLAGRVSTT